MRHNQKKKHLGRTASHRKAMLANLVTSLFERGRIRTTQAKAKEGRKLAERLITSAKKGDLHARRQVLRTVHAKAIVKRLFDEIGPRFADRNGGYTRIVKLGPRLGDRAPMVLFELLGEPVVSKGKKDKEEKRKKEKTPAEKKSVKEKTKTGKGKAGSKKEAAKKTPKTPTPPTVSKKVKAKAITSKTTPKG